MQTRRRRQPHACSPEGRRGQFGKLRAALLRRREVIRNGLAQEFADEAYDWASRVSEPPERSSWGACLGAGRELGEVGVDHLLDHRLKARLRLPAEALACE